MNSVLCKTNTFHSVALTAKLIDSAKMMAGDAVLPSLLEAVQWRVIVCLKCRQFLRLLS